MSRFSGDIARYVIDKCYTDGDPVSNIELNCILYLLQIFYFKKFKRFLFDEDFRAARFGPILPTVYFNYCGAGACSLRIKDPEARGIWNAEEKELVDSVIEKARKNNPWEMATNPKGYGKAWAEVFKNHKIGNGIIPRDLIVECLPVTTKNQALGVVNDVHRGNCG